MSEGYDAITPYNLLGIVINNEEEDNDEENKKIKRFDISSYDVIIFEEIYFNEFDILLRLYEFMLENKDMIYLANGDPNQLECCQDKISISQKIKCVNTMFPNQIDLKIIKRGDSKELYEIKQLIELNKELEDKLTIEYIVNKYFKNRLIKDIKETNIKKAISYTNETRNLFNKKMHRKLYNIDEYIIGQKVICLDHYKFKNG